MKIKEFKKSLSLAKEVTLIGPLLKKHPKKIGHPFIFVDRGANYKKSLFSSAKPGFSAFSVGDGDSSREKMDILLPSKKDFSDLKYALDLLPENVIKVNLWGFLGGRRDHEIINFGEVNNWLLKSKRETLFSFEDKVFATVGDFKKNIKGNFSLIVFGKTRVKIIGNCEYKLIQPKEITPLSSLGLSNFGKGEIKITSKRPFFIFLN